MKRLDEDASLMFPGGKRFRIVIVGGSALILLGVIERATLDIDALEATGMLTELLGRHDINTDVRAFIDFFPHGYESRISKIFCGQIVDFYTASIEDIVIAKLFSHREKDIGDLGDPALIARIDWDLLDRIVRDANEIENNVISEMRYQDFLGNYKNYLKRRRQ
jgi:hypothetical protein